MLDKRLDEITMDELATVLRAIWPDMLFLTFNNNYRKLSSSLLGDVRFYRHAGKYVCTTIGVVVTVGDVVTGMRKKAHSLRAELFEVA